MTIAYQPLVSCLCLTSRRPAYLKRAIDCFMAQTYSNKELVVFYQEDDLASAAFIKTVQRSDVRSVTYSSMQRPSLGELRNFSVEQGYGEYFCQWDDDDWYHNKRLEVQVNAAVNNYKSGSALAIQFIYDAVHSQAFLSPIGPWPQTILCKKDIFNEGIRYPGLDKHEDAEFMLKLYKRNCVIPVIMPSLYLYTYHGSNTWNYAHFNKLFSQSQKLSAPVSRLIGEILDGKIANAAASELLMSPDVLKEINYLHQWA